MPESFVTKAPKPLNRVLVVFIFAFGAGLGPHIFRCLQLGAAERAEEHRVIYQTWLVFFEINKANGHVDHVVGADSDERLEIAALDGFLQSMASFSSSQQLPKGVATWDILILLLAARAPWGRCRP